MLRAPLIEVLGARAALARDAPAAVRAALERDERGREEDGRRDLLRSPPFQSARSLERAQTGRPPKRGETNGVDSERAEKVVCGRRVRRARDAERGGEGRVLRLEVERASAESGERTKWDHRLARCVLWLILRLRLPVLLRRGRERGRAARPGHAFNRLQRVSRASCQIKGSGKRTNRCQVRPRSRSRARLRGPRSTASAALKAWAGSRTARGCPSL